MQLQPPGMPSCVLTSRPQEPLALLQEGTEQGLLPLCGHVYGCASV